MDDSFDDAYGTYVMLPSTQLHYLMMISVTHYSYIVVVMTSKMHKFHMVQLWMRIHIVIGSHKIYCLRIFALDGIETV